MTSLHGTRVLVTSAGSALGRSLCEAFLACGAEVIAADLHRTRLDELRASLGQHARLEVAECDLGDAKNVDALLSSLEKKGELATVIHAVPAIAAASILDGKIEEALLAPQRATALVLRGALVRMRERRSGVIVVAVEQNQSALAASASEGIVALAENAAREVDVVRVHALTGDADEASRRAIARASVWLACSDARELRSAVVRACA